MKINIVLPMAGISSLSKELDYPYPTPLVEINGKTLIELIISQFCQISDELFFTFILSKEDCSKYNLDKSIKSTAIGLNFKILIIDQKTDGALCSVMRSIDILDKSIPLIISNFDQLFTKKEFDFIINQFLNNKNDAAVASFNTHHPRWAYILLNEKKENQIQEVVEKTPISSSAIAGLYFFKSTEQFFKQAMQSIYNERKFNNQFYISSVFNEYILSNLIVKTVRINNDNYFSFYTAQRLLDFEKKYNHEEMRTIFA